VPAPLAQLRGRHRWRFLIKAAKSTSLQDLLARWVGGIKTLGNVRITVDIDPYSFF
jgi:primosomal protein N' (replication factor Y)